MHKLKNKHTGEVITTPYLAEIEEYLKSGDYEMKKPVYTKEMHERGEWPPIGSYFVMNDIPDHVRYKIFEGLACEVLALTEYDDGVVVTFNCNKNGFGALWHNEFMEPLPTIEDELCKLVRGYYGGTSKAKDLANEILSKYNITPK